MKNKAGSDKMNPQETWLDFAGSSFCRQLPYWKTHSTVLSVHQNGGISDCERGWVHKFSAVEAT